MSFFRWIFDCIAFLPTMRVLCLQLVFGHLFHIIYSFLIFIIAFQAVSVEMNGVCPIHLALAMQGICSDSTTLSTDSTTLSTTNESAMLGYVGCMIKKLSYFNGKLAWNRWFYSRWSHKLPPFALSNATYWFKNSAAICSFLWWPIALFVKLSLSGIFRSCIPESYWIYTRRYSSHFLAYMGYSTWSWWTSDMCTMSLKYHTGVQTSVQQWLI